MPVEPSRYFVQMLAFVCSAGGLKALPMVGKLSTIERLPNSMTLHFFNFVMKHQSGCGMGNLTPTLNSYLSY